MVGFPDLLRANGESRLVEIDTIKSPRITNERSIALAANVVENAPHRRLGRFEAHLARPENAVERFRVAAANDPEHLFLAVIVSEA